jgi:hypothetical protein
MSLDISKTKKGDMTTEVADYSVDTLELDAADGSKEYKYTNNSFDDYMGYLDEIAELSSTIKAMARWSVGKGYKTKDEKTKKILGGIVGWGKDSFNEVIKNDIKIYMAGGDSVNEIIRKKIIKDKVKNVIKKITGFGKYSAGTGELLNLKPLNAGKMSFIVDEKGMLKRYEYNHGTDSSGKKRIQSFEPNEIFHLAWDRIGDQIHGTSIIRRLKKIILARNEAMEDQRIVFHRYVKPLWVWKLNTDDATKIADFQAKADKTVNTGENIYIPKGAAESERVSVPQYSTLDPLPWIDALNQYFYQAANVPDVILGSAKQTVEASAKMLVFAFEQSVEEHQLFLEENIKSQLGLEVNFEFPASIAQDLFRDNKKDGPVNIDKKETKVNLKGKK